MNKKLNYSHLLLRDEMLVLITGIKCHVVCSGVCLGIFEQAWIVWYSFNNHDQYMQTFHPLSSQGLFLDNKKDIQLQEYENNYGKSNDLR